MLRWFLAAGLLLLAGCTTRAPVLQPIVAEQAGEPLVQLADTPFFPQQAYQCGPAALATVLNANGVSISPEQLVPQVYLPERRGSLQVEMIAAARRYDQVPVVIEPGFSALLEILREGRPVLVLQNLGLAWLPVWHYAVVIGYDATADTLLLRSGTERLKRMKASDFIRSWTLADNWGLVLLDPEDSPGTVDAARYLTAVSGLEAAGRLETAKRAYATATLVWPDQALTWLGLGNVAYHQGRFQTARNAYYKALELVPGDPVVTNNLAQVLTELGCAREADRALDRLSSNTPIPNEVRNELIKTRQLVEARSALPDGPACRRP
ncbi:MAG: PA2778 family cysteine peptidase [Chromatiales bacterium]